MKRLDDYFSDKCGAEFSRCLPKLRKKLGVTDISNRKPGYGVAGNTFRAYQGWHNRPSDIYNGWAERIVKSLESDVMTKRIESREGFLEWHGFLLASLERRWRYYEGGVPDLAHRLKLVDLFIKWLSGYDFGEPKFIEALEQNEYDQYLSYASHQQNSASPTPATKQVPGG